MKNIKFILLLSIISCILLNHLSFGQGTGTACTGTGVKCVVSSTKGDVISEKDKEKPAVVIHF